MKKGAFFELKESLLVTFVLEFTQVDLFELGSRVAKQLLIS